MKFSKLFFLLLFLSVHYSFLVSFDVENSYHENFQNSEKAYFASGCFWCVELIFESLKGVDQVYSGYSGGYTESPTYSSIGTGQTGHAESVEIHYDPEVISFRTLVEVFFRSHDPTTLNRQGPDKGPQYRSIAFYQTDKEKEIIENYIDVLLEQKIFKNPIVTEVLPFEKFNYAEEYHQDFEKKNPNHPYVKRVSIPRLKKFASKYRHLIKDSSQ
ncbi:MAG: peptide-methionine (S)-S-oxide reductase MsrA [Flavobacteriaceae bacterium]|nr:peptide-methionine (S)-S-oxide reductase MsrA [Flavobacteriaceae bacterium]